MTMTKDVVLSVLVVVHHLVLAIVMADVPTIVMDFAVETAGLTANPKLGIDSLGATGIDCCTPLPNELL